MIMIVAKLNLNVVKIIINHFKFDLDFFFKISFFQSQFISRSKSYYCICCFFYYYYFMIV